MLQASEFQYLTLTILFLNFDYSKISRNASIFFALFLYITFSKDNVGSLLK